MEVAWETKIKEFPNNPGLIRFDDATPPAGENPWVAGVPEAEAIEIVPADPRWPEHFQRLAERIQEALGALALEVEHVGSTSVPRLSAKPIVDIDLIVANSADEAAWLPQLEAAGFVLTVRERNNPADRALYRDVKVTAAEATGRMGGHVMEYNARKQQTIREIYNRAFAAAGLLR